MPIINNSNAREHDKASNMEIANLMDYMDSERS